MPLSSGATATSHESLARRFSAVRSATTRLCLPLSPEDCVVQSMPDASPTKWHLAHATWFFETFVLKAHVKGYRSYHPEFGYLFNSYYNGAGPQYPRPGRGLMTRPSLAEVLQFRTHVDEHTLALLERGAEPPAGLLGLIELGLHHEQQHQELILMDIKHVFSRSPLHPVYAGPSRTPRAAEPGPSGWTSHVGGLLEIGHAGASFRYDNECPRHRAFVHPFELANRLVTNGEYLAFIEDRGYERPELWLADGWSALGNEGWSAPLYWIRDGDGWCEFTLGGVRQLDRSAPVCHVNYYEAAAYARWADARLPEESEWEVAATGHAVEGNFVEAEAFHPLAAGTREPAQLFGDLWEWTRSAYAPYPGFRPAAGVIGEYNGKFMCNQQVLRGGSCVTPQSHIRTTYRNFFYPGCRWQFAGIRLARDT